ncbi:MAG: hypothetical protein L3K19_09255 [Thermoplasmata archaeon]|nr:hypothetical protein [Thermoplasmata archaeon]
MSGGGRAADQLDASVWLGVGVVGVLVFFLGIWKPALAKFPYSGDLQVVVAIAGGAIAYLGFSRWWDEREYEKLHPRTRPLRGHAREIAIAPSFEVYDARRPGAPPAGSSAPARTDDDSPL